MAVFNSSVLTARGSELLVDAVAGDQITFTRMVVGCGVYSDAERERNSLEKRTALKDARQEFTFSAYKKVSEQCVLLTAVISNRELDYSYKITEIGIYGKRSRDTEDFLCSVAVTKSLEESDTFPPYNGLQECQIVQDYYITISPDAEVSVITQGACVLREEFEELKERKLDKDGDGSDLTVDFKQASKRQNITPKTKLSVMMGIISKVIADLKGAAFCTVVNDLMTTEEGGVLDARVGKTLQEEIESMRRSFLAGCKMITDRLTALGYTPVDPQGPAQIVVSINTMYDDRYNAGRAQGRADVIADPGAYGINSGIDYGNEISLADGGTFKKTLARGNAESGNSDPVAVNETSVKNFALNLSGKTLYAIDITLVIDVYGSYSGRMWGSSSWTLATVEGTVIAEGETGRVDAPVDGNGNSTKYPPETRNIYIDLLETPFNTEEDHIVLTLYTELEGYCGVTGMSEGTFDYQSIAAKYK